MHFPKDFPEKLRSQILTSEVVGKKVRLKARGKEFHGLCPFHNEKTPSFTVNDQKGFFHCFGCSAHGDLISFVMQSDGLNYHEAVVKLAEDFGIPIPQVKFNESKENQLERDYLILEKIAQFFEKNLFLESGRPALSYLQKRGISRTTIKKFRLGFAPNSFSALIDFLKSENFTDQEISRTGAISQNDKKRFYDKFRNRVIFPITDKKNRPIAFGGRTIGDDLPKYLNSAETEFFKKNQTLYNFYHARKAVFDKAYAVIVEGYVDVISLVQNGIENVLAGLGTALSEQHLRELFHLTDKIIICLDGDEAGIRAAKRASEIALPLINAKKNVAFAFLPNQLDPDDFIKEFGVADMERLFADSIPLSESLFEFALRELKIDKNRKITAENKAKIEVNLASKIALITDISSRKYFSLFFKDLLFFLGGNSVKNFGKNSPKSALNFSGLNKQIYGVVSHNVADSLAQNIVAFIIKFPELARFRDDYCDVLELHFQNENLSKLKELVLELIEDNPDLSGEKLIAALEKLADDKNIKDIKNIFSHLEDFGSNANLVKFRILLLKELSLKIDEQYKETLKRVDEIETHQTAVINQKIKEIFTYRNSLEQEIAALEKEII